MSAQVVPRCEVENHSSTLEEEAISVGYTTDIWSSIGTESYITLTAHFTTSDFEQKSYILATKYVRKAYWCDIEECVLQLLSEWNLEKASGTSISMTTDNASNMETAVAGSNWKHIHCVAHTLNLCVDEVLQKPAVQRVLARGCNIVLFFHCSPLTTAQLKRSKRIFNFLVYQ